MSALGIWPELRLFLVRETASWIGACAQNLLVYHDADMPSLIQFGAIAR
jgi:hypothetical protein